MAAITTTHFGERASLPTPFPSIITDPKIAARLLPTYTLDEVKGLMEVDRGDSIDSKMITHGLAGAVSSAETYQLLPSGELVVVKGAKALDILDLEYRAAHPARVEIPSYLEIEAVWDKTPFVSGSGNNILGDNGRLIIPVDGISIPCVEATDALLGYYGATLVEEGSIVQFPDECFPLFAMSVGENYTSKTLMTDAMGGFYLEYHTDRPHWHFSIHSRGYYLLARWNDDHTKLQMTGFSIPDGKAIYSKKGAIHCDAGLIGDLIVGYSTAYDCSTVLLVNPRNERMNVSFKNRDTAAAAAISALKV